MPQVTCIKCMQQVPAPLYADQCRRVLPKLSFLRRPFPFKLAVKVVQISIGSMAVFTEILQICIYHYKMYHRRQAHRTSGSRLLPQLISDYQKRFLTFCSLRRHSVEVFFQIHLQQHHQLQLLLNLPPFQMSH